MKILASKIPEGSHGIRVWPDLPPGDTDTGEPYAFSCNLAHVAPGVCAVEQGQGELTDAIVVEVGLKAIALGYTRLSFHRTSGGPATRWARLVKTEGGFDYYEVDLIRARAAYQGRGEARA